MNTLPPSAPSTPAESLPSRLIIWPVDSLRPHPGYVRNRIAVPASQLSQIAESGDLLFREPLTITRDGIILDGYARWNLAQLQGRPSLPCFECDLSEVEALQWLLQKQRRSNGLNDFNRILLAVELEPMLREQARWHQQLGGQLKGSSRLADADRLDVRSKIAAVAGVSTGNLNKARQLISYAHPDVLEALRSGEISINRASGWLKVPEKQLDQLRLYQNLRGIARTIGSLQRRHRSVSGGGPLDLGRIASALASVPPEQRENVLVAQVRISGNVLLLSPALLQTLTRQGELPL